MAIDNKTESSAVINFGMFPWVMLPFTDGTFGPEESAPLLKTYGEAGEHPSGTSGKMAEKICFGVFGDFGMP